MRRYRPIVETLETRYAPAAPILPLDSPGQGSLTPALIRHAYGVDQVPGALSAVLARHPQAITFVEATYPTGLAGDLGRFDAAMHLPKAQLSIVGSSTLSDRDWGMETRLDVEWAHAVDPEAKEVVMVAPSASGVDIFSTIGQAGLRSGTTVVSMSFGSPEFAGEDAIGKFFLDSAGANVVYVASSGDSRITEFPAAYPGTVSVGGTTLAYSAQGAWQHESPWTLSGGGKSLYEPGSTPLVAWDGDPATGFPVYDSSYANGRDWYQVGGTSAGAPQWSALVAIANSLRAGEHKLPLAQAQFYKLLVHAPQQDFHAIKTEGRGSPQAQRLVPYLVAAPSVQTLARPKASLPGNIPASLTVSPGFVLADSPAPSKTPTKKSPAKKAPPKHQAAPPAASTATGSAAGGLGTVTVSPLVR